MRKFKTAEENRTNYIYYYVDGSRYVIEGQNTTFISKLHEMDDAELDAERREEYGREKQRRAYESSLENNVATEEKDADPLEQILASIEEQEHAELIERLRKAIETLTDLQQQTIHKKYYRNMSNVDIAAEEGVSEAAIRNRLNKIHANLRKKITE